MEMKKRIICGMLCLLMIFTTGCAGLLPGYCGGCGEDDQAAAFFDAMTKYTDPCYVSRAARNTAYPGTNYILRMAEEKREKENRQEEYNKKMQFIGVLALVGMITGGVIGYYNSLEPDIDLGDVRWLGAACGAALGVMPAAGIYYLVQLGDVLK